MRTRFARHWWMVALRGLIAVLFGVAALVWPRLALEILVLLFGAFALADGIIAALVAIQSRHIFDGWWVWLLEGLVGLAIGVAAFIWPALTERVLLYLIAAWAIITGVLEVIAALGLREIIERVWLLALDGILSVILGVLLVIRPAAGAVALAWLIGLYAIVAGVLLLVLGFWLRSLAKALKDPDEEYIVVGTEL
jgi:uncharacterized membrane protein HdeD (DUF308 family)